MTAVHLLRNARGPLSLSLVERGPRLGRGAAYGTDEPSHLLNVPAAKMSAFADDPGHFLLWLQGQAPSAHAGTFAPRRAYAVYLESVLQQARGEAGSGVRFEPVHDDAVDCHIVDGEARVLLKSGRLLRAARVVLATGNFPPASPLRARDQFLRSPRYIASPWSTLAFNAIRPQDSVLLIGAGLTTADVVLALKERGHNGTLDAVSRHGLLPQPHRPTPPAEPFFPSEAPPRTVRKILRLLRKSAAPKRRAAIGAASSIPCGRRPLTFGNRSASPSRRAFCATRAPTGTFTATACRRRSTRCSKA